MILKELMLEFGRGNIDESTIVWFKMPIHDSPDCYLYQESTLKEILDLPNTTEIKKFYIKETV